MLALVAHNVSPFRKFRGSESFCGARPYAAMQRRPGPQDLPAATRRADSAPRAAVNVALAWMFTQSSNRQLRARSPIGPIQAG